MAAHYYKMKSPIGNLNLVSSGDKLTALVFDQGWNNFVESEKLELIEKKDKLLVKTEKQLNEYFSGNRTEFDIPLEIGGTDFQNKAWKSLLTIPFGQTVSYAEQALKIKNPKAVRAVGAANAKNKIAIIIPCHRVVGKNGSLTGFAGGLNTKQQLLELERSLK